MADKKNNTSKLLNFKGNDKKTITPTIKSKKAKSVKRSISLEKPNKPEPKSPKIEKKEPVIVLQKKSTINELPNKDNKVIKKLDLIDKQLEKSEEILYNQNKILTRIKEISGKIEYFDKNFESVCYKNDVENFNLKLSSNDENLQQTLNCIKNFSNEVENVKYLQEQNKNLKYKLDIVEVEKDDKNLFYENKLNTFESHLGGEIFDLFNFLKSLNLNVPINTPNINSRNIDEHQIALFFANLKQVIKALKIKSDEKNKDLKFVQYDRNNLLDELNAVKRRVEQTNMNEMNNIRPRIEEGKIDDLSLSKTLNLEDNIKNTQQNEQKYNYKNLSRHLNFTYTKKD